MEVTNIESKGFSNQSIPEKVEGKPHICKVGNYWRVSPLKKRDINNILRNRLAHIFVQNMNKTKLADMLLGQKFEFTIRSHDRSKD